MRETYRVSGIKAARTAIFFLFTFIIMLHLPSSAMAFESEVFTLDQEPEKIEWLDLPYGWELFAGISIGTSGDELVIQVPSDESNPPAIGEFDWPARLVVGLPKRLSVEVPELEEAFNPGISVLIDHFSLQLIEDDWLLTLYLKEPLSHRIEYGIDSQRIRVRYLGTVWHLITQAPNWRLWNVMRLQPGGMQNAYIVQIDPRRPDMTVRIAYAGFAGVKTATVADFVRFTGATGGINGGFFSGGMPLGLLVANGEVVSPPMLSRPCLAFNEDGTPYIGDFQPVCRAVFGRKGVVEIDAINDFHYAGVVLLTPGHPERIRGELGGRKLTIENGIITEIVDGPLTDLSGKTIIWDPYNSSSLLGEVITGDEVKLNYSFYGFPFDPEWIIQAGPILVKGGVAASDFTLGSFLEGITRGRAPRSAAAVTVHGEVLLFMGEGRLSLHSLGFTLNETAQLLIEAGAVDAINLDGGGSCSLFVGDRYYGYPFSGTWKAVPDAILFGDFHGREESAIF